MAWTGYSNDYDEQAMAVAWGMDWEYSAGDHCIVWTWDPTGDETRARIVSIDPIVMGLDGKTVDIRVTVENTDSINSARFSDWNLNPNNPPMIGKEVKLLAYGENGATDDWYVGTVKEIERVDPHHVVITISDRTDERLSQLVGDILESGDYSYMPDEAIGLMKPIIFGELTEFVPILVTEPPRTRLSAAVDAWKTSLSVDDTTDFPSSGTLIIEDEELTYTGKTSSSFTGVSGGANSTSDSQHPAGAYVYLKATTIYYVSEHSSTVSTVYGYDETTDTLVDITSQATVVAGPPTTITFSTQPKIIRKRTSPVTAEPGSRVSLTGFTQDSPTVTNVGNIYDGDTSTYTTFTNPDPFTARASGSVALLVNNGLPAFGNVLNVRVSLKYGHASDTVGVTVSIVFDPGGGSEETVTQTLPVQTTATNATLFFHPSSDISVEEISANPPDIIIKTGADTAGGSCRVYEVEGLAYIVTEWEYLEYSEHPIRILALDVTGLRNAVGNAGDIITDILTATSFTSAGLTSGDLNTTTLSGLGTYHLTHKFSGAIMERQTAKEVVSHILPQMGAGYYWDRGRDFAVYWDGSTPGSLTLTDDDILSGTLASYRVPQLGKSVNYAVCHYDYSWLRKTYRESVTYESTTYSTIYGQRRADIYADWVRTSSRATNYATRVVNAHAQPPLTMEFETPLKFCPREQYDLLNINAIAGDYWDPAGSNLINMRVLELAVDPMRCVCRFKVRGAKEYL